MLFSPQLIIPRPRPIVAAAADASQTTAFLARTSGLDALHTNAYKALINGLVADAVFTKLDALYTFATKDSTTALLSLVSATFNASVTNAPTFTGTTGAGATGGYTGNGSSSFVDSGFNPSTATTPNLVQNSACLFAWSNTSTLDTVAVAGTTGGSLYLYPRDTGDITFYGANDFGGYTATASNTDGSGLFSANRSGATAVQGYRNGSSVTLGSATGASAAVSNANITFCKGDGTFSTRQIMAGGFGQSLSSTDQSNLYARLHTFLQTVAGIA